jgi:hypothetical protein
LGFFKVWKAANAVAASGAPAGQAQHGPQGMMAGFAGAMAKMMGPMMAAESPERGGPLPGTEPGVLEPQDAGSTQGAIAALRARDSAFDPQVLTTFTDQLFAAVSSAWGTGDPSSVRALLADKLWDPLAASLASGLAAGPGAIYSRQTGRATLSGLWAGAWYDTARFNIAVSLDLPRDDQHPVPPGFPNWTEDWLLQRSVKPGGNPMVLDETCPSCGAGTATDTDGLCTHCHQPVPVLTAGWLVTFIRSYNPAVEMVRAKILNKLAENPQELRMMPDELVRLLPPEAVAKIDPRRAAALGLQASS